MSVLANNISSPLFLPSEVESAKSAALYETQVMWASAKQVLPEVVIQNAFKDNTLGHPSYLTEEQSPKVGELELRGFMKDWFKPERTIVTGLGMPHEELVELVQEHFEAYGSGSSASASVASSRAGGSSSSLWGKGYATVSNVELPSDFAELSGARARYTGGEMLIEKEDEEYTHLAVAFEAPSVNDPDVVSPSWLLFWWMLMLVRDGSDAPALIRRNVLLPGRTRKRNVLSTRHKRHEPKPLGRPLSILPRGVQRHGSFRNQDGGGAEDGWTGHGDYGWTVARFDGRYDGWSNE